MKKVKIVCIGIKVAPEGLDMMFRQGYSAKIRSEWIPDKFKLKTYGYDFERNVFYFIFATNDCPEGM